MADRLFLLWTPAAFIVAFWGLSFFLMVDHPWLPEGVSRATIGLPLLVLAGLLRLAGGMQSPARAFGDRPAHTS